MTTEEEIVEELKMVHPDVGKHLDIKVLEADRTIDVSVHVKPEYQDLYTSTEWSSRKTDLGELTRAFEDWFIGSHKGARGERGRKEEIAFKLRRIHPDIPKEVDIKIASLEPEIEVIASVKPEFRGEYEIPEETFRGIDVDLVKAKFGGWWFKSKKHAEMLFPTKLRGVTVKTTDEIMRMLEAVGAEVAESPKEFVSRMIESGNRVLYNPYGTPIVEIIAPAEMRGRLKSVIDRWDINPTGHGVLAQEPSFAEQYPSVAKGLVAYQFMLQDREDPRSSGYDLERILSELKDELVIATKSPSIAPKLKLFS